MWQKARDVEAAVAAAASAAPAKGKGRGRGVNKRRAQEQPEGQRTPKKSTRSTEDLLEPASLAPAPQKGLLASAAEVEANPEGTPIEEDSMPASPEPPNFSNGVDSAALLKTQGKLTAREKSPPLPKNISDPDEYGFRIYNQRPSLREKGITSRLFAPRQFYFEEWEIGFRDTANDSTKGHTRAKRGKYLDTPNSNGFHYDHWCNGYDYSQTTPEDFDADKIKRYGLHPRYGIFRSGRTAVQEESKPCVMPGKPVVYIANPSGRIHHASRSFQKTTNHRRSEDTPWRAKMGASLRRFCKLDNVAEEDIDISEYVRSDEQLQEASLGTAIMELESRPVPSEETSETDEQVEVEEETPQPEPGFSNLDVLSYALAFIEGQESTKAAPPTPKPVRYDAIRDVFTDSRPAPTPAPDNTAERPLNLLADVIDAVNRSDGSGKANDTITKASDNYVVLESSSRSTLPENKETPVMAPAQPVAEPRYNQPEVPQVYMQAQPLGQPPLQPAGPVHPQAAEMMPYAPVHEHAVAQHPAVRPNEYQHVPPPGPPGPPVQDQGPYHPHGGFPGPDPRDIHMSGRPVDPIFGARRLSSYTAESTPYSRPFWASAPPPPAPGGGAPGPAGPQLYQPQPPPPSRIPFSHNASAEPLPPLRPPRGRNHSVPEDPMMDPNLRPATHNGLAGAYYPPAPPPRSYHRGYGAGPEPLAPLQPIVTERILPNPQQAGPGYMNSYAPQILSPTYANPPSMANQMAQGPMDANQGPNSIHRHRSTPSSSSDAGNKYRKLQPAPVPAHRNWNNKPELKTIPYDHKETGSAAALPSSGPTQIRGWNVNQPRKRGKADKQDRSDPSQDREDSR